MSLAAGSIDGWVFTIFPSTKRVGDSDVLESFDLSGKCPHGYQLVVQDEAPIGGRCGCVPTKRVLDLRARLSGAWAAQLGKPITLPP